MANVTDEINHRINVSIEQVVRKIQSRSVPEHLFHYTNGPGFIGIIEQKGIWATHIAYTNDSQEYFTASGLVRSKIETILKDTSLGVAQKRILVAIQNNLGFTIREMFHCFVACFSAREDDLAQWRGYSGKEGKYKIAFDFRHLIHCTSELNNIHGKTRNYHCYFMPVIYEQNEKDTILNDVLNFIQQQYPLDEALINPHNKEAFAHTWAEWYVEAATFLAPLIKDSGFSQESEWRLVIAPMNYKKIKYRNRGALLTPYLEVDFKSLPHSGDWVYPFREVWIGPSAHMDLNEVAAKHLLDREEVKATLKQSSIPYRDV